MAPKPATPETDFISRLDSLINMRHRLVRLAYLIDWAEIERTSPCPSPLAAADLHCRLASWPPEPVLAVLLRRGLPADRSAHRPEKPHALGGNASARKVWRPC